MRHILFSICIGVLLVLVSLPTSAQGNSAIAQQFQTKDNGVTAAALVVAEKDRSNSIELATAEHADRLVGVVNNSPLIELSNGDSGVQVVTSGLTLTLVSDLNGKVRAGDKITVSPIAGVGMKAIENTTMVGIAQSNLDIAHAETRTITDKSGKEITTHIGLVSVRVGVAFYNIDESKQSAFVPSFLQELANNVSGRDVSPIRVLIAALILLLLFVSISVLLYSAVRSSIISIGRNPLSERAVRKSLFEVGLTVFVVLLLSAALVYIVLTV